MSQWHCSRLPRRGDGAEQLRPIAGDMGCYERGALAEEVR